jgi:hypothetical protein
MAILDAASDMTQRLVVSALDNLVNAKRPPKQIRLVGVVVDGRRAVAPVMERHGQWRRVVIEKCRGDFGREGRRAERARRGVPRPRCRRRSASFGRRVEPMHSHPIIDVRACRAPKSSGGFHDRRAAPARMFQ